MAELAPGAQRLAVQVQISARNGQHRRRVGQRTDQVDHRSVAEWCGGAERQPQHRPQVVRELAGLGALDRPMAGVVDARGQLVGDEPGAGAGPHGAEVHSLGAVAHADLAATFRPDHAAGADHRGVRPGLAADRREYRQPGAAPIASDVV